MQKGTIIMADCYYLCEEGVPGAQRYAVLTSRGKEELWLARRECPEPLCVSLAEEANRWIVSEYYTEDDDHGDAFRYFDSETILHKVTVENAIVRDGAFAGAFYTNRVNHAPTPVLLGSESYTTGSSVLSSTHTLDKQSHAKLLLRDEAGQ